MVLEYIFSSSDVNQWELFHTAGKSIQLYNFFEKQFSII